MANTFITVEQVGRDLLASIKETAAKYGVSEVDLANALAGSFGFNSPMSDTFRKGKVG